ncbi:hypothetical protein [Synechococcus sp. MIT S9507]|uniref:hypothetical protein n=1 Tax=Synechococcus sp. MIT S9507 TaxID=3082544 RepID=UPI0039B3FD81
MHPDRCHDNKTTTYVVDFANESSEILEAFQTYYQTAQLSEATDPNLILDLKTKLDVQNHYDENEIDRVVGVLLNPNAKQSQLISALEPVAQRLMNTYKEARQKLRDAENYNDPDSAKQAKEELEALTLFRRDMGTYVRFYTFLSQIFDYGNSSLEKRALFYKRLLPLLEFEREINTVDLSKVVLTHHNLRNLGERNLALGGSKTLPPSKPGGGSVNEKEKARLAEIISKLNDLFTGDLTDDDKLTYVGTVIKNKLLEDKALQSQAASNTKEQFSSSPDLMPKQLDAVIKSLDVHQSMSSQVVNDVSLQKRMLELLLGNLNLYEDLKARAGKAN